MSLDLGTKPSWPSRPFLQPVLPAQYVTIRNLLFNPSNALADLVWQWRRPRPASGRSKGSRKT